MTDEVQTAIDRLRDLSGDVDDCLNGGLTHDTFTYRGSLLHDLCDVAITLQKAVLGKLPTDDPEPITPKWLAGLRGRVVYPNSPGTTLIELGCDKYLAIEDDGSFAVQEGADSLDIKSRYVAIPLGRVKTRGDVRRLAAAMGMTV